MDRVWSLIRKLDDRIGEGITTHMRAIAKENLQLWDQLDGQLEKVRHLR